jgi:hypothetical protein
MILESVAETLVDLALEIRYEMIEECADSKAVQIAWLRSALDRTIEANEYREAAAVAALLHEMTI